MLYPGGAISATVVDHWVGNLARSNLRLLYIFLGILCYCGGLMYLHVLKGKAKILNRDEAARGSQELFLGAERKMALG